MNDYTETQIKRGFVNIAIPTDKSGKLEAFGTFDSLLGRHVTDLNTRAVPVAYPQAEILAANCDPNLDMAAKALRTSQIFAEWQSKVSGAKGTGSLSLNEKIQAGVYKFLKANNMANVPNKPVVEMKDIDVNVGETGTGVNKQLVFNVTGRAVWGF